MNDNTILRIKVPAHLYESVKEQLTINEAKSTKAFGDWKVVKEKKLPKDGMKKVEEADKVEETNQIQEKEMEKKTRTLDELKAAKQKLEARINEMEMASKDKKEENLQEFDPKFQGAMDVLSSIPGVDKIAQIDPFLAGVTLVGMAAGALIAAPKIEQGIKALIAKIKDPKKKAQLAAAAEKEGLAVEG